MIYENDIYVEKLKDKIYKNRNFLKTIMKHKSTFINFFIKMNRNKNSVYNFFGYLFSRWYELNEKDMDIYFIEDRLGVPILSKILSTKTDLTEKDKLFLDNLSKKYYFKNKSRFLITKILAKYKEFDLTKINDKNVLLKKHNYDLIDLSQYNSDVNGKRVIDFLFAYRDDYENFPEIIFSDKDILTMTVGMDFPKTVIDFLFKKPIVLLNRIKNIEFLFQIIKFKIPYYLYIICEYSYRNTNLKKLYLKPTDIINIMKKIYTIDEIKEFFSRINNKTKNYLFKSKLIRITSIGQFSENFEIL